MRPTKFALFLTLVLTLAVTAGAALAPNHFRPWMNCKRSMDLRAL